MTKKTCDSILGIAAALSFGLAPVAATGAASVGNPIVYHSPSGDGTPPSGIPSAQFVDGFTLHLYIDYDNTPDGDTSQSGTMCVDADGDETCAFDVKIQMQTDLATLDTFTPAASTIVGHIDPVAGTLRVNGVDTGGMPIPAPIGTLVIDAADANQLQLSAVGMHRVGAAGQLDAIQSQVLVPEPSGLLLRCAGVALLAGLAGLRGRGRAEVPSR